MKCKICGFENENKKKFCNHINAVHKMKIIDYVIEYMFSGIRPLCPICNAETRYSSFSFKKYCNCHSHIAESEAGRIGGKAIAWNKGLTKNDDKRIHGNVGSLNPFYGKHHTIETKKKISNTKTLNNNELDKRFDIREDIVPIPEQAYVNRQKQHLLFKCTTCGTLSKKTLKAFEEGSTCPVCFPNGSSIDEREVVKFIEDLGFTVERNNRSLISPKELDIYIPSKNLAIEYNGLYWHSEFKNDNAKLCHKEKTLLCDNLGISLFHIFSDEWKHKNDIVKSMIMHRLGVTNERLYARNCKVAVVPVVDSVSFFNETHISGNVKSKITFGLYNNGNLISCVSLRIPRQKRYEGYIEIARFSTKRNCIVVGGFSKLMKSVELWAKENGNIGIISYADLRFGKGNVYLDNGFSFLKDTGIDYWYTNGNVRFNRFKFRAQNGVTEKDVASTAGVSKIYGCGSFLYKKNIT